MRSLTILSVLLFSVTSLSATAFQTDYQIKVSQSLAHFDVKICFDEYVPDALYNGAWNDNRWLQSAVDAKGRSLKVRDNKMRLKGVKPHECIRYQALLSTDHERRPSNYRAGKDMIFSNNMWLWQPKNLSVKDQVTLNFKLPKGNHISTPWTPVGAANQTTIFRLTPTPYDWDSRSAIGQFNIEPVKVGNQTLLVAALNSKGKRKQEYIDWIKQAAGAIAGINGDYPIDNAQILITPTGAKREAVPWGEVQRGGSTSAHFFVDSFRPIQEFKDDWTAAHELSHMLVPFIDRDELWLSEGIASYYQNVARAKASMISTETSWQKLLAGFSRGTKAAKKESLSNSSSIMQMYWGGAAMYLMADVELRKQSNNRQNLGTVLQQFNRCCRPSTQRWGGLELMQKFDELSGSKIFSGLYQSEAQQRRFPDIMPVLNSMGIKQLKRQSGQPLSDAARSIMQ